MPKSDPKIKIKALLFDLGKVIVHFDFRPAFRRLSKKSPMGSGEIEGYFLSSGLEVLYDAGKMTSSQFYRQVKKATRHSLDYDSFKKIWNEVFTINTPMLKLIKRLSPHYRLVLISNTNAMHYEYLRDRYAIFKHFDRLVLSFKEKIRKPDARIYRKAARACQAAPREIFYIDDRQDLTEAARDLGFQTFTFKNNLPHLLKTMKKLGISFR